MSAAEMRETGFVAIREAISAETVAAVDAALDACLQAPGGSDRFGLDLSRLTYAPDLDPALVLSRVLTPALRARISALIGRELCLTQVIGFELRAGDSQGFRWHVGHGSFAYQRIEDFGATLWIPLVPVETAGQHGGVACVPRSRLSGDFLYRLHRSAIEYFMTRSMADPEAGQEALMHRYRELTRLSAFEDILEHYRVELDYAPGDALLFDKYVIHRSCPLRPGPIPQRRALVLRFVDTGSRFSQAGAAIHSLITTAGKAASASQLPGQVGLRDGELLITSAAFDNVRQRILRPGG